MFPNHFSIGHISFISLSLYLSPQNSFFLVYFLLIPFSLSSFLPTLSCFLLHLHSMTSLLRADPLPTSPPS